MKKAQELRVGHNAPAQAKESGPGQEATRVHGRTAQSAGSAHQSGTGGCDVLLELAQADRGVLRQLTARFNVPAAPDQLVAATHQAIADATDFDEREINRNFDYDYEAYGEVKRNLGRLIDSGRLRLAMQLALELMKQGSYRVEMSDEGMMTEDIEDCLSVVIKAMQKGDLPADERRAWSTAMRANDRVGFIAREQLESLCNR